MISKIFPTGAQEPSPPPHFRFVYHFGFTIDGDIKFFCLMCMWYKKFTYTI